MKPFDPDGARPGDIATDETSDGKDGAGIVRQERGVINRSAYIIKILHDPAAGPAPTPPAIARLGLERQARLHGFGPGVGAGYHMGRNVRPGIRRASWTSTSTSATPTAAGSLSVFGNQPSDVLSAETFAKVKERFIEEYGVPIYTLGQGGSGGSMQQQLIANAYPGLLDAIMPQRALRRRR